MAEDYNSDMEKTEEPTQYRIDEFRKRGEVASSRELTSALILFMSLLTLILSSTYIYEVLAEFIEWVYAIPVAKAFEKEQLSAILNKSVITLLLCAAPVCLITFCTGIIAGLIQTGPLFSPAVLSLKWDRINPVLGFKRLFSMRSVVEALKGFFKFFFIFLIIYIFMKDEVTTFTGYLHMDFSDGALYGKTVIIKVLSFIIAGLFVIAALDFSYQKFSYHMKLRMTKDEAKRERKEQESNPEIRQRIRSIQKEMAKKRMLQDVQKADVIVTNPKHISVALKYDAEKMSSPQVLAKGADFLALTIRKTAKSHDIPIVENVSLARSIYKTVKIGEMIPRELYQAVAEVLSFVYKLKNKTIMAGNANE